MTNDVKLPINLETVHCPECHERMPFFRLPETLRQLMWGGWTCPKCGCRMDRWGRRAVAPTASTEERPA
ncbi:MAG: hypothetical protein U0746_17395 [Gemmataceae bacterium]